MADNAPGFRNLSPAAPVTIAYAAQAGSSMRVRQTIPRRRVKSMRVKLFSAHALALLLYLLGQGSALAAPVAMPAPPSVDAETYILYAARSEQVLVNHKADKPVEPASITKLMTAYIVFTELKAGRIQMDDMVTVSKNAWQTPGSSMFIEVGTKVSVEDLLRGMIIQSGNDAAVALAEYVAGSVPAFANLMNHYADMLGLQYSHFENPTGLPHKNHYMSAHDIALLSDALIETFPNYYDLFAEKVFTYNDIRQYNRNDLLWRDPSVDGLKTGHTSSAGYCLAASAKRDGMRLISVVLGADSDQARVNASQALLNYGFRFYDTHTLYEAREPLKEVRVWKGAADKLTVGINKDMIVTIPSGRYDRLDATMELPANLTAPIDKGAKLGQLEVSLDGELVASAPLIALEAVPEGSWWEQLTDRVRLWFVGDE